MVLTCTSVSRRRGCSIRSRGSIERIHTDGQPDVMQAVTPSGPNEIPRPTPKWRLGRLESPGGLDYFNVGRRYDTATGVVYEPSQGQDCDGLDLCLSGAPRYRRDVVPHRSGWPAPSTCPEISNPRATASLRASTLPALHGRYGLVRVCDPEVSGHCTGFPEWNVCTSTRRRIC